MSLVWSSFRLGLSLALASLFLLALSTAAACGYDDRDFDDVAFSCNLQHPCPDGRACINGRCAIGAGSGSGSGSNSGELGVRCGAATCAIGLACCASVFSANSYCAPAGTCVGSENERLCDGKEDCTGGRSCCLLDAGQDTACVSGECGGPPNIVCSSDSQCPSSAANCCDIMMMGLKQCLPIDCPF